MIGMKGSSVTRVPVQCRPKRTRKSVPANGSFARWTAYSVGVKHEQALFLGSVYPVQLLCQVAFLSNV